MRTLVTSGLIESPMAPTIARPTIAPPSKEYIERKFPHLRVQREDSFVYDVRAEYARLGVRETTLHGDFRLDCDENCDYSLCSTYPAELAVPTAASAEAMRACAAHRGRGRLPVLSWRDPASGVVLIRCAQPKQGLRWWKRSAGDEAWAALIREASGELAIVDARPLLNAVANHMRGGGYEHASDYGSTRPVHFCAIPNIHAVRAAFAAVAAGGGGAVGRWLDLQASLLGGAAHVARLLAGERTSVFLHCSDGWDRTPQLTSLAMLLCDAHYRSLRGFAALVEKEWLSFGHCFETRAGRRGPSSKAAPIFEQFLDAVWQLVRQQPAAFEFGEAALLALAIEARRTDGRGPFRGDSAAERAALAPPTQTVWEVLRSHRGAPAADLGVLRPRCDAPSLAHWEALFRLAARPRGASEYSI